MIWVSWPRSSRSHAAVGGVHASDVRSGGFPLLCGRWAPDGWDTNVSVSHKRPCAKCAAAARARQ